jgi:tetratricopeptide (TPR) repeat protein
MGFLRFFSSKSPADLEQSGDRHMQHQRWGAARMDYQRALNKLKKHSPAATGKINQLQAKVRETGEILAENHLREADNLLERGFPEDARELFELALELTQNPDLTATLEANLHRIGRLPAESDPAWDAPDARAEIEDEAYFEALIGTLPERLQATYSGYGSAFRSGYLALHRGDFELAVAFLEQAQAERADKQSYIALELATAYFHLGRLDATVRLLNPFLQRHAEALPAYQLLCEIGWQKEDFDRAENLLSACPEELKTSVAYGLLWGENLDRRGRHAEAIAWYRRLLEVHGFDEKLAAALARIYETTGENQPAMDMYGRILSRCRQCGAKPSLDVKRRYAELAFASGNRDESLLELYLSMVREDPVDAGLYFGRISYIYARRGHHGESRRFRRLAEEAGQSSHPEATGSR